MRQVAHTHASKVMVTHTATSKQGEQFDIALWDGNSENPKAPALKGKVSDKYVADGGAPAGTQAADSVPF